MPNHIHSSSFPAWRLTTGRPIRPPLNVGLYRAGRSILAVLIFHGMMNFSGEWLQTSPDMYPFMLTGNVLAAVLVALWWIRKKV